MYRRKIMLEDVGLQLDENGKFEFCPYDDGFELS
jgi:hypothetical protein